MSCCNWLVAKLCLTLVTPWTLTHQAPLSMGFTIHSHGTDGLREQGEIREGFLDESSPRDPGAG